MRFELAAQGWERAQSLRLWLEERGWIVATIRAVTFEIDERAVEIEFEDCARLRHFYAGRAPLFVERMATPA